MTRRLARFDNYNGIVQIQDKELRVMLEKASEKQLRNIADWIEMRRRLMPKH